MPAYEYKCDACGYIFEKFQGMKDKPIAKCPTCGGKVQRLIGTGAGVIFKGSGFYAMDLAMPYGTDYTDSNASACGRDKPCCGRDCTLR